MSKSYSIAEARNRFAAVVHEAEEETAIEVTRRGKPVAIILSVQRYRQLQAEKSGFWSAYETFRDNHDLNTLDIGPEIFEDVRDRSPGREVSL